MKSLLTFLTISFLFFELNATIQVPPGNFLPGWKKDGSNRIFDHKNLYGHIDGGAELFFEFGFVVLNYQRYQNKADELILEIYEMENSTAALGIYLMKCGQETPVDDIDVRNTVNSYQILFVKGACFVQIYNLNGEQNLVPVMIQLAQKTLENIPAAESVEILKLLPEDSLLTGSAKIFRGNYALQSIYTFGSGDVFLLGGKISGVLGDYHTTNGSNFTLLLIPYPDSETALKAFQQVQSNLDPYLEVIQKDVNQLIFKDYKGLYGIITLKGDQIQIKINLITTGD
ncbi:hypothetical protein JW964_15895 [candidate division KSB1 bacterium]|nr:hypothetical protein [candidate division KSB1 bacterium]